MRSRPIFLAATVAVLGLAVSGCAADGGEAPLSSNDATLVYAITEPDHLTPGRQLLAFNAVMPIFSPLVSVDDSGEISYVQAASVESDDATTWTITLRDGWTFHNGEPVTAQSYVDAWNYTALSTNAWENAGSLAGIQGYSDVHPNEGEPTAETMSGLQIVDDTTFTVTLSSKDSSFPLQISQAMSAFYPMPDAAYDDLDAYDRKPIGNGPYEMVDAWEDNTDFSIAPYADYQGNKPSNGGVTFQPYADMNVAYNDVRAGNVDLLALPASKFTTAAADFGDQLKSFYTPAIDFLGFPLEDERYADKRVRQAVSMAIDRDAVNTAIYGDIYEPATALTSPILAGTPEGVCGELCEFDPDAAKKLLEEAGGWTGPMEIYYPGGKGDDDLFQAYANQIRQNLGIVDVVATPSTDIAEFVSALYDGTITGLNRGHWGATYPSQRTILRDLFTSGGDGNVSTRYSNPEVDALLTKADAADSTAEAEKIYAEVQNVIMEDFPVVPTFFNRYAYVVSDRVTELPTYSGIPVIAGIEVAD